MAWSKLKKQMEEFICPSLKGKVEYLSSGYRYLNNKIGRNCIIVDRKEVFQMTDRYGITWYQTEQDIRNDASIVFSISDEEKTDILQSGVPLERVMIVARNKKLAAYGERMIKLQTQLLRSDFYQSISLFLASSIDQSLNHNDILPNVLALIDRRIGKKRLGVIRDMMYEKHPVVQYFYQLRCAAEGITIPNVMNHNSEIG